MRKIIKGIVKGYSKIEVGTKPDNKTFAYVDMYLLDHSYPYRFFFDSAEIIKEKVIDRVPIGSTVEFEIFKKGEYWNIDKKSFEVLIEGDGTAPKSQKTNDDYLNKLVIVKQNALSHADSWAMINQITDEKDYFAFADKCVDWIMKDFREEKFGDDSDD